MTVHTVLLDELADIVRQIGQSRMILCRCDNEEAVRIGQRLGITLYQGRFIDELLSERRAVGVL